ncbi:MAG TPA: diguanylate cyclase [Longimicrobium sp.]|nr:diguanylate cyclase [Longimicrobium sp.]
MANTLPNIEAALDGVNGEEARAAIDALNRRTWDLRLSDPAEALRAAGEARAAAQAIGYARGEAYALRNVGGCRCLLLQYDAALAELEEAAHLFGGLDDAAGSASTLNWIGNVHWRRSDYVAALRAQTEALALQRAAGDRFGEGDTLNYIGAVYHSLSDLPRALEHYRASLALKEDHGDTHGISQALNNIGNIHGDLGQYAAALEHHTRSLHLRRQLGDRLGEGIALANLGSSHEALGDYPRAMEFYHVALRHTYGTGDLLTRADVLRDLGDVHRKLGDLPSALGFYREAIEVAVGADNASVEAGARVGLGQALAALDVDAAVNELRAALKLAKRIDSPRIAYEAHLALSTAYEAAGDLAAALEHYRAYHRVEDEVNGAEAERRIQALLVQAEIERSQREAELLRAQAAELERLTREDALTGVFNRRHLDAELALEWERARRFSRDLAAVMVDVDHFKAVNDGWSHATGDAVLRQVARLLRDGTRAVDVVGRYGGEEFLLVLVETPAERAALLCEKLRAGIEAHDWSSVAPGLRVTASFGVAGNTAADTPAALLAAADACLYAAKHAGRNRVVSA